MSKIEIVFCCIIKSRKDLIIHLHPNFFITLSPF